MLPLHFGVPVRIAIDARRPIKEIYSVEQALDVLQDWPGTQDSIFQTAFDSCFGAMTDVVATEDARKTFLKFARACGILAKDSIWPGY
jgi:hypothetical protein